MTTLCTRLNQYQSVIAKALPQILKANSDPNAVISAILAIITPSAAAGDVQAFKNSNTTIIHSACDQLNIAVQNNIQNCKDCVSGCVNIDWPAGDDISPLKGNYRKTMVANYGESYTASYEKYLNTVCSCTANQSNTINTTATCTITNILGGLNTNTFNPITYAIMTSLMNYGNSNTPLDCTKIPNSMSSTQFTNIGQACINSAQSIQTNSANCGNNVTQTNAAELLQTCIISNVINAPVSPPSVITPSVTKPLINTNAKLSINHNSKYKNVPAQQFCQTANAVQKLLPDNWNSDPSFKNVPLNKGISNLLTKYYSSQPTSLNDVTTSISSTNNTLVNQVCNNQAIINQTNLVDVQKCLASANCNFNPMDPNLFPPGISQQMKEYALKLKQDICANISNAAINQNNKINASQSCIINNILSLLENGDINAPMLGLYQKAMNINNQVNCSTINTNITADTYTQTFQYCSNLLNLNQLNSADCGVVDQSNALTILQQCLLDNGIINNGIINTNTPVITPKINTPYKVATMTPIPTKINPIIVILIILGVIMFFCLIYYLKK